MLLREMLFLHALVLRGQDPWLFCDIHGDMAASQAFKLA